MPADQPAYLRIAADLRRQITSGDLPPGARLPSEAALMQSYGVSNTIVKNVRQILVSEGLVEARKGSGVYVIDEPRRLVRHAHGRTQRTEALSGSPFARDASQAGYQGTWQFESERADAPQDVAERLGIGPGDAVMRTRYLFLADDFPIQLTESWEALAITSGSTIEWPEYGESGTGQQRDDVPIGVVARMDSIGVRISHAVEEIEDRAATPDEIEQLRLPPTRTGILHIQRTYYTADDRPVETADIVLPGRRYRLHYRIPIA
ncbi:MAG: GntR family transcriptional regulator [Micromonosporaceae bacterium]